jgi:biphenyl 2,3-dioxygenase beta subunit
MMQTAMELIEPFKFPEKPVSFEVQHAVEQFYFREAQLLDHRKYQEWLELLTEDIHYWVPIRTTQASKNLEREYYGPGCNAHFDEDYARLRARIRGRQSGLNWTEDPPSRSRHIVSNVIVREVSAAKLEVSSAFLCYRNRLERMTDIYVGERRDVLLRTDGGFGFKIDKRTVLLDQSTITANNLSMFF